MTEFRSPRRREVRQRSGFSVAEETSGGECKVKRSQYLNYDNSQVSIEFSNQDVELPELFQGEKGMAAFGGYILPEKTLNVKLELSAEVHDELSRESQTFELEPDQWGAIGTHVEFQFEPEEEHFGDLEATLTLENSEYVGRVDFFGINLNGVNSQDFIDNIEYEDGLTIEDKFNQRTTITVPYLYFLEHEQPFETMPQSGLDEFVEGKHLILKSCNRCARFLPTEHVAEKERNLTSFGNHCVQRAPCDHSTFGSLEIIEDESDLTNLPPDLDEIVIRDNGSLYVDLHYGYQLECKACKKFYVNAALNFRRNSTQHREDALRRRAIEVLVRKLLDEKWIYHEFRQEKDDEFDRHIWEKFDKSCFKCGKKLGNPLEMHLDHTMPLAALWPLSDNATCLCSDCNSKKSDKFPIDFYTENELQELGKITGLSDEELKRRSINTDAVDELIDQIEWFFDDFLDKEDYQKERDGKKVADLIVQAIQDRIDESDFDINLVAIYRDQTDREPETVSLESE